MPKKKITTDKKVAPKKVAKKAVNKVAKKVVKKEVKKTVKPVVSKKKDVVAKKATPKKVAPKKRVSSKSNKALVYSDDGTSFWVTDGKVLNSLLALNEALNEMEDEVFSHHVNDNKHDFAEWVQVVLADEVCAKELRETRTPNGACRVVSRHLKTYRI